MLCEQDFLKLFYFSKGVLCELELINSATVLSRSLAKNCVMEERKKKHQNRGIRSMPPPPPPPSLITSAHA